MTIQKITPILVVHEIEPCLPFWTEGLGFTTTATVPHEDHLGFAMLERDGVVLMYQSRASVEADLEVMALDHPGLAAELGGSTTTLFIEVADLDPVIAALSEADVEVPRRQTFYGMDEIFVRAPCGTLVGFAARVATGVDP